jgi:putative transposase
MTVASCKRHRFPPAIIAHAVWLCLRFSLSRRAVEKVLLERGMEGSCETLRRRVVKFGPVIARGLRRRQDRPGRVWRLDEVRVSIRARRFWLWRAVDGETDQGLIRWIKPPSNGAVLEELLQPRRDRKAATRLLRRLLKNAEQPPKRMVGDKLAGVTPRRGARSPPVSSTARTRGSTIAPRTATCRSDHASG